MAAAQGSAPRDVRCAMGVSETRGHLAKCSWDLLANSSEWFSRQIAPLSSQLSPGSAIQYCRAEKTGMQGGGIDLLRAGSKGIEPWRVPETVISLRR